MTRTIEIDEATYVGLQQLAVPLEDTAGSVVARLVVSALGVPSETLSVAVPRVTANDRPAHEVHRRVHSSHGNRTPQADFMYPLLDMLVEMGGGGHCEQVLSRLERKLPFKPADLETLPSGEIRWRKDVQWCRHNACRRGWISDEERGVWKITPEGRSALEGR